MGSDNLTARFANLSPAKRALLELRLNEKSAESLVSLSIPRRSARDTAPLSFAQQRLWFLNQLEPESPAYNESSTFRLSGTLDRDAFKMALNQVVLRHEVLRTTIVTVDGSPCQVIVRNRDVDLPVIDLYAVPNTDRYSEAQRLIVETIRKPFDLSRDLMLRVLLLQLAEKEHIFLVVKHHIASDKWSSGILWKELTAIYEAFVSGETSPLPELPIQYADYAVWQREWLQGDLLERQLSYWKKQLAGLGALQLPTDRPRPSVRSYQGNSQTIELSKQLSQKLEALSRQQGTTLFMTLLAAFQTLLYRYTGQEDIAVGCPIAGRTRQELEGLIGFFVNTLVLRVDFSGHPTFRELLARVREVALGAYGHQDLPFEKLVEELQPERNLTNTPLFQVAFAYQNTPNQGLEIPGVLVTPVEKIVETTKFDWHLSVNNADERIGATLYYATDLYDDVTIARLLSHFRVLLEGMVADPDRRVSELPILTEAEEHQLLVEWNDTNRDYPKNTCIHQLFGEQVEKSPDAVAVVFENQQLTYRELNTRANQLARYLYKLGVRRETLVGICMERSLEMVVGLLGILKAGGAYVPLDPKYPKERLAFILRDTHAPVLLTQRRMLEGGIEDRSSKMADGDSRSSIPVLCELEGLDSQVKVVCLDTDSKNFIHESTENPQGEATADNLAYVIYTSGSTGRPKGVAIEHRSALALLSWAKTVYTAEDLARILASTSICFDLSVFELFCPLASGDRVIMVKDALGLSDLPPDAGVTLVNTVPSAIAELLRVDRGIPASVRIVNLAGEPLSLALVHELYQRETIQRVFDLYGPSEATTYSTYALRQSAGPATIGRPIANTQIYILDSSLQPVPLGISGELHIGGAGLARGYLNRSALTAEKFLPNPFSKEPGARLYKTGDLARYLPDGNIEFLGRIDHQVKLRGFRIELGEIESALSQHPGVGAVAVLARQDLTDEKSDNLKSKIENPESGKRLVAYVVPRQEEAAPTGNELRIFLEKKLPEYMIPSAFVFLDALPPTPNGKIDRQALPAPDQNRVEAEQSYVAPRNPVEELLANIWAEVLKLEKIGVHDNFFGLGGHSLKVTQVISRVREALRLDLPVRVLFEAPTIAELASRVEQSTPEAGELEELARNMAEVEALSEEETELEINRA